MNGNVSREGIRADFEWMKRIGIGGFQNFDAGLATPQVVEKRLIYMTPEWKDAFRFTTELADSLGLEMAIAGSPGWSESVGPWVNRLIGDQQPDVVNKYTYTTQPFYRADSPLMESGLIGLVTDSGLVIRIGN